MKNEYEYKIMEENDKERETKKKRERKNQHEPAKSNKLPKKSMDTRSVRSFNSNKSTSLKSLNGSMGNIFMT